MRMAVEFSRLRGLMGGVLGREWYAEAVRRDHPGRLGRIVGLLVGSPHRCRGHSCVPLRSQPQSHAFIAQEAFQKAVGENNKKAIEELN